MQVRWEKWGSTQRLNQGDVHVLVWRLTHTPNDQAVLGEDKVQAHLLDEQERNRAARFVFDRHRIAYVQAHAAMRRIFAAYLGVEASAIKYAIDAAGKPRLAGDLAPLNFNLSHTEGFCALALCTREMEIGIDVERVRPMEHDIADIHFSPTEREQLSTLHESAWQDAFFRCWTRKEALLKGEGLGLRIPLDSFDVSLLPGEPARLEAHRPKARFTTNWRLHHFQPEAYVTGAVAISGEAAPQFFRVE